MTTNVFPLPGRATAVHPELAQRARALAAEARQLEPTVARLTHESYRCMTDWDRLVQCGESDHEFDLALRASGLAALIEALLDLTRHLVTATDAVPDDDAAWKAAGVIEPVARAPHPPCDLVARWCDELGRRALSQRSIDDYRWDVASFMRHLGDRDVLAATTADVEAWLLTRSVDPRSQARLMTALSSFYRWAVRAQLTAVNPVATVDRPRLPRCLPRPIAQGDLDRALRAADPRMKAWLVLGAYQGLRCAEIARLRREDLRLDQEPAVLVVVRGKGGHQRTVPLHPATLAALHAHGLPPAGYLFPGYKGPLVPNSVSRFVSAFLRGIGVEATAHQLRHYFGSALYQQCRDLRLVQELMGHSSPNTTAGYAAWSCDEAAELVCRLGSGPSATATP